MSAFSSSNDMSEDRGRSVVRGDDGPEVQTLNATKSSPSTKIMPPAGLMHLKTKAENRAQTDTIQVWTLELPAKAANHALKYV